MQQMMGSSYSSTSRSCVSCKVFSQQTGFRRPSPRTAAYAVTASSPRCSCNVALQVSRRSRWDSASSVAGAATRVAWGPVDDTPTLTPAAQLYDSTVSCSLSSYPRTPQAASAASVLLLGLLGAPVKRTFSAGSSSTSNHSRRSARIVPLPTAVPSTAIVPPITVAVEKTDAAASASTTAQNEILCALPDGLEVVVRNVRTLDELRQVATLRAEAYYAENQSRFVGSLKKKFVEQEVESLQQRTTILSRQGQPYSECMVALDRSSGAVLACIDVRLPAALNGTHPHGVPQDDPHGCYLLNVVVRDDVRGRGLGRALMRAAMGRVVGRWGAARLYTHVEADNEVACQLYSSCGFRQHSVDPASPRYDAASQLGQRVLLVAPAEAVTAEAVGTAGGAAAAADGA